MERQFEIIGEALNRLHKVEPALADQVPERRRIISFRNVLAHGYDQVDHSVVWKVIEDKLPKLVEHVEGMLASMTPK